MQKHITQMGFLITLTMMLALANLIVIIPPANTQAQSQNPAKITITPEHIEVGQEGVEYTVENRTEPFTITVEVSNVTDLFAWQVTIWYLHSILGNASKVSYPEGHVFQNNDFTNLTVMIEYISAKLISQSGLNLTNPLGSVWDYIVEGAPKTTYKLVGWIDRDYNGELSQKDIVEFLIGKERKQFYEILILKDLGDGRFEIKAESAYVQYGAAILSGSTFSGDGTLCKIEFEGAIRAGQSPLNFTKAETYLLNSTLGEMPYEVGNATVIVHGIGRDPSTITINADPERVTIGKNITISGEIEPTKRDVPVEILYRRNETGAEWKTLATVTTGTDGKYTYVWTTNQTGEFKLKSKWAGDAVNLPAESKEILVRITAEGIAPGMDIKLYIIAAVIAVIIIAGIVLYLKKFRS
jgi:hypothetical protein